MYRIIISSQIVSLGRMLYATSAPCNKVNSSLVFVAMLRIMPRVGA